MCENPWGTMPPHPLALFADTHVSHSCRIPFQGLHLLNLNSKDVALKNGCKDGRKRLSFLVLI